MRNFTWLFLIMDLLNRIVQQIIFFFEIHFRSFGMCERMQECSVIFFCFFFLSF